MLSTLESPSSREYRKGWPHGAVGSGLSELSHDEMKAIRGMLTAVLRSLFHCKFSD
jgi:hypothetical protein